MTLLDASRLFDRTLPEASAWVLEALYQLDDGMCIAGPCLHLALERLPIEIESGELFVLVLP